MPIEWNNLRILDGSQDAAFEELCCQLARYERVPQGSIFIRKGAPDAGLECYWKLPNGDEWGWQAKFFLSPPGPSQWNQIDNSISTALDKHPSLTLYTICIPQNRQDPRIEQQRWFMDRWNINVEKWETMAKEKGMSVQFNYWGEHELWERIGQEEHRGRYFFFFNKELFSQPWFEQRIDEAIANVGPRYTPELNVELPIAKLFESLGKTLAFYDKIRNFYGIIKRTYKKTELIETDNLVIDKYRYLQENINSILLKLVSIIDSETKPIDWESLAKLTSKAEDFAFDCIRVFETKKKEKKDVTQEELARSQNRTTNYDYSQYLFRELSRVLSEFGYFLRSEEASISNISNLLLVGEGGVGKTHLFCDVAKHRVMSNLPTILLLGGNFNDAEPWSQIINILGLSCNREEFLGAIEASAQARGSKALFLIDALDDGDGKLMWSRNLGAIQTTLSRYNWISFAVSVRISYEDVVIPVGLVPNRFVRKIHYGFADNEYQATKKFFDHYGIEYPSIPLLVPEFQNPLFLKLFCESLEKMGLTKVPPGLHGISEIFNHFIESVNHKLSKPDKLNFDPKSKIVQKSVDKIAEIMANKNSTWLDREVAQKTINEFLPPQGFENSLFRNLISEGVIAEDIFLMGDTNWSEGIRFSYSRFTDHLVAKHLLDKYLNTENPEQSFMPEQSLGKIVKDELSCSKNRGLIEALSIQLPEIINKELFEVAPHCASYTVISKSFIKSLIWRDFKVVSDATLSYINNYIIKFRELSYEFLDSLLTIASNPKHPLNADFLHRNLMRRELSRRDASWSIFLHHQYGQHGAVDRLVDWAWSPMDKTHIDNEAIRLSGQALLWFLTSSNRFLRDRSTKALINLFKDRIHVLRKMIPEFINVNDPYVLERLFAVCYGCALRNNNNDEVGKLAEDIFKNIFEKGEPPPHILLRNYARSVIELAISRGYELIIDVVKVRPPYKSEWPNTIPTRAELESKYGEWKKDNREEEWARIHLFDSVMGTGDFARYVIGTNSGRFEWSSRKLGEPREQSQEELYNIFIDSLTDKQRRVWEALQHKRREDMYGIDLHKEKEDDATNKSEEMKREAEIEITEKSFRKTLGKKKLKIYEGQIISYLNNPVLDRDVYKFDLSIAQRWILQKVFDLGWSVDLFGNFDSQLSRSYHGREANKPERIGKKYQWIAYHEFLARVSDNFEFKDHFVPDKSQEYDGPWQLNFLFDIDPSCLLTKTAGDDDWKAATNSWWNPVSYNEWDTIVNDIEWLKNSDDLPAIEPLISVSNPNDGSQWLNLETYVAWEETIPPEEDRYEIQRHKIYYMLRSYIVKKDDFEEVFKWAQEQYYWGRWMPESRDLYQLYLGEMFWAASYQYLCTPYFEYEEWTRNGRRGDNITPKEILVTSEHYLWETLGYDCSIDKSIYLYLPCKWLVDNMKLHWNRVEEGYFLNQSGELVAFDPSLRTPGPTALLVRRDKFLNFLNENGYEIFWTLLGEKYMLGGRMSHDDYKGNLEISGAYRILEGEVDGKYQAIFRSRA